MNYMTSIMQLTVKISVLPFLFAMKKSTAIADKKTGA